MDDRALVDRLLKAMNEASLADALDCLAENVFFVAMGGEITHSTGDFSGHDGFREWWSREVERGVTIEDWALTPLGDGRVFADVRVGAPADGGWLGVQRALVCTVKRARILAIEVFRDSERALVRARDAERALGAAAL